MNVGANLRRIRRARDITQADLARSVGVNQSMIAQIERGTRPCTIPLGVELARALGCTINDLIAERDADAPHTGTLC